jgi:fatty acid desaturase
LFLSSNEQESFVSQPCPLPPALLGDQSKLSNEARTEIRDLSGARPGAFLAQAFGAWGVILGVTALALQMNQIWMSVLAIVIVATRFNILGLLVHEQVHFLGLRGRYGDLIVNLLAAYPLIGLTVENYAGVHLAHHKYFFTEKDPDFLRKSGAEWNFPMPGVQLAKLFLSDLLGLTFIKLLMGKRPDAAHGFRRPHPTPKWVRPVYFLAAAALLTYVGMWLVFLIYWVLPLMTVFPVIVRLGAIAEHIYDLPSASVADASPLMLQKWWEKLLLPNLNFTLHPYHHYYPGVAHCNLPKVHEIFRREKLVIEQNVFHGYWAFLKYLQCSQDKTSSAATEYGSTDLDPHCVETER